MHDTIKASGIFREKQRRKRVATDYSLILAAAVWLLPQIVTATTYTVQNTNGVGIGSLRMAIQDAGCGDTINFATNLTGTIGVAGAELLIDKDLTIIGPGAALLRVSGHNANRVFNITNGIVYISGLTIADGKAVFPSSGGAVFNRGTLTISNCILSGSTVPATNALTEGGAIFNSGTLLLSQSLVVSNTAPGSGGIFNSHGFLTVLNCTFSSNLSTNRSSGGGAIANYGTTQIYGSTFVSNSAGFGGAIENGSVVNGPDLSLTMTNCTVASNTASISGGGIHDNGGRMAIDHSTIAGNFAAVGGGIFVVGTNSVRRVGNTIVAENSTLSGDGLDIYGAFVSDGYNLVGKSDGGAGFGFSGSHDQVGFAASPIHPNLGPLQDNGGPTKTMALLSGSPALDQGRSNGLATDQRGRSRPVEYPSIVNALGGDGSDIGSFEFGPNILTITNLNDNGPGSLRQTIVDASSLEGDTLRFASNLAGTLTLSGRPLIIDKSITVTGNGAKILSVSGNDVSTVFDIRSGEVNISKLTITRGLTGVYNSQSTLQLNECAICSNRVAGIFNYGTLTVMDCAIFGNSSPYGGGLSNGGEAGLTNTTISGNFAEVGGGIYNDSVVQVAGCTITDNDALTGGGLYNYTDDALIIAASSFSSIIAGNRAGEFPDVAGLFLDTTYSLIGKSDGSDGLIGGLKQNQVGSVATPLMPLLAPLADYGGSTPSHALLAGSPALDRGKSTGLNRDQRGQPKPYDFSSTINAPGGDGSDIGAVEWNPPVLGITRSGGQTVIFWPEGERLYHLETIPGLSGTNDWSFGGAPVVMNRFNTVTETPDQNRKLYRLALGGFPEHITGALIQDFEAGTPINYSLSQLFGTTPASVQNANSGSSGRFLRLLYDGVNDNVNAITFNQTAPGRWPTIQAEFDFRLTSADAPADGFAFMLIPTAVYGTNGPGYTTPIEFEEPNVPGVFAVGFDVHPHSSPNFVNDVSVHWNGTEQTNSRLNLAMVDLASGNFHRCRIVLTYVPGGAVVAVFITPNIGIPGISIRPIVTFVPGLNPFDSRVEFAGRSGALNMSVDLDNINALFTTARIDY